MPLALPPYALAPPTFRFRHLANLAGRAPIGGAREVALACFVVARLASECTRPIDDDATGRVGRSAGAKAWLGTLALPAGVRSLVMRCADLSVEAPPSTMAREVAGLTHEASPFLDVQSRAELDGLVALLGG